MMNDTTNQIDVKEQKPIGELRDGLQLTTGAFEADHVLRHIGVPNADYGMVFTDQANGEYTEVWAAHGNVPCNGKTAHRLL